MGVLNWKWASFHENRYSQLIRTSTGWMFMVNLCLNSCANVNLDSDRVRVKWKQSKFILIKRICSSKHEMVSVSINHSCFTVYITVLYVWVCFLRALPTSSQHNMDAVSNSSNLLQFVLHTCLPVWNECVCFFFHIVYAKRDKNRVNRAPFIAATHSID